jgi:hypothetical protein
MARVPFPFSSVFKSRASKAFVPWSIIIATVVETMPTSTITMTNSMSVKPSEFILINRISVFPSIKRSVVGNYRYEIDRPP